MKKTGYIVLILGIIILMTSYPAVREALRLSLPTMLSDNVMLLTGVAITVIGALFILRARKNDRQDN